jgi:glyoxylase-like metal-dependent hydrolase (beta-lactamase superfamily II)
MTDAIVGDGPGQQARPPTLRTLTVGEIEANCYLLQCPETGKTLVVDPGAEPERILRELGKLGGEVALVLHTHGHFDHISGTESLLAGLGTPIPLAAHPADAYLYTAEQRAMGVPFGYALPEHLSLPNTPLADGQVIEIGTLRLEVIATPGHTPGSISLLCGELCLSGDTLFRRGIGRTDLLGGDEERIYESILTRLYPLPPQTRVYPGHGPATTIGEERRGNPFVRA